MEIGASLAQQTESTADGNLGNHQLVTVPRFTPLRTPLSDLRSRWHPQGVPIGPTIDSAKLTGAVEGIENMNVATLTYSLRKKILKSTR